MNIAINAWVLRKKNLDGIGTVTKETCSRIIAAHPEHHFFVLLDKGFDANYFDYPNATLHRIFPALRHPVLYIWYLETVLPRFLKRHKIDGVIAPDGMLSLSSRKPQVPCIHDLNFVHQPDDLNLRNRLYYQAFVPRFVRHARRIATVSEYSKHDIESVYDVAAETIDVIYCGIKDGIGPMPESTRAMVRTQYTDGNAYFFFVGTIHPRKNVIRLIRAFDLYKASTGGVNTKLVLAGSFMWDNEALRNIRESLHYKDDIILTGRVSEAELSKLYAAALAVTFVPTFEGFGIPIVEGFASGVPVMCSNVTSLPEVAGDAALLVNPLDEADIASGMARLASDSELREKLIRRGFQQAARFSWDDTARRLWDCCAKAFSA